MQNSLIHIPLGNSGILLRIYSPLTNFLEPISEIETGYNLKSYGYTILQPTERRKIFCGLAVKIPQDYVGIINYHPEFIGNSEFEVRIDTIVNRRTPLRWHNIYCILENPTENIIEIEEKQLIGSIDFVHLPGPLVSPKLGRKRKNGER